MAVVEFAGVGSGCLCCFPVLGRPWAGLTHELSVSGVTVFLSSPPPLHRRPDPSPITTPIRHGPSPTKPSAATRTYISPRLRRLASGRKPHVRFVNDTTPEDVQASSWCTMFGNLSHLIPTGYTPQAPKDVPPPTLVNFPLCRPQERAEEEGGGPPGRPSEHLTSVLQGIIRPTEVTIAHLEALGSHVIPDSTPEELIPDASFIPDFRAWEALSADEAHAANERTRRKINTGALSPGCQTYLERKRELSVPNEAAYRAIRRVPAPKGQAQARLGNSFEFYRYLELFSTYWDDTSAPPSEVKVDKSKDVEPSAPVDGGAGAANSEAQPADKETQTQEIRYTRTGAGHQMPPDYRQNITSAFVKLVAYDFGCNATAPRTEPRLYITSNTQPPRSSYFSSGCTFIFRTPTTREAARSGVIEGPVAAISARHTITFPPARPSSSETPPGATDRDSVIDLARELIAALVTAQHRAREGREERRIGEGAWWATKPRWGGGPGGPIGREVDLASGADETFGDKDAPPPETPLTAVAPPPTPTPRPFSRPSLLLGSSKGPKRLKKSGNLPMYDSYRMVRPPAAAWDRKTRYSAIGRAKGVDYDDIFMVSSLFHHVSILRVRVPDRLLAVLDGADDAATGGKSWGRLEARRSKWYDLFLAEERLEAMRLVWSMMAYLMREADGEDVSMVDA
ncbi:hypothetical protein B0T14DRAFT_500295 [Immersiella caudata]|uniref:Uncharacterized protein n=1 Tax=Immersiella caudata TaxID=314043 RepID=A0AA39U3R1_9PEZI|nr:hypothetical protein B0T14DRAFT_500295 [Immersiella caudata]